MKLEIKNISNLKWKAKNGYYIVKGFAFYVENKGYLAFESDGLDTPCTPNGGKKTLERILETGGFLNYDNMAFIKPMEVTI